MGYVPLFLFLSNDSKLPVNDFLFFTPLQREVCASTEALFVTTTTVTMMTQTVTDSFHRAEGITVPLGG